MASQPHVYYHYLLPAVFTKWIIQSASVVKNFKNKKIPVIWKLNFIMPSICWLSGYVCKVLWTVKLFAGSTFGYSVDRNEMNDMISCLQIYSEPLSFYEIEEAHFKCAPGEWRASLEVPARLMCVHCTIFIVCADFQQYVITIDMCI